MQLYAQFGGTANYTESNSEGLTGQKFILTPKGEQIGEDLARVLSNEELEGLETTLQYYNDMTLMSLLEYVYEEYESMTGNSEIKEEVLY